MAFDVVGKLHVSYETKQVSAKFSKREFVVEVADGKYPQMVLFQLTGDRCTVLDDFRVGDQIRVTFNVRGREWKSPQGETKYFNSLDVWKLERTGAGRDDFGSGFGGGPSDDIPPPGDDDIPF